MSTDKQSSDSPADQIARCRDFAKQRGWNVVESLIVSEAGISGASRHNRPGLLDLFARIAEWNLLLCWDSSRLARDSEDLGWIRNQLRAHKRSGFEASTGLDLTNIGAKMLGVIAEEYLVKLRADTQRGLRGRAERGLSTGGRPYGYRTDPIPSGQVDAHGNAIAAGYRVTIDEAEAPTVRRIFEWSAAGEGLRAIARRLNAERVAGPRPRSMHGRARTWSPSALHAILRNPIYRGELVWNRSEWIKEHATGKRKRFERPPSEWVRTELPEAQIVEPELWERVQEVKRAKGAVYVTRPRGGIATTKARSGHRTRGRHLLAGLLECAECRGSFFDLHGTGFLGCGWRRDRGVDVCSNALRVAAADVESRVLGAIREQILVPEHIAYAVERALARSAELLASDGAENARARLPEVEREIANVTRFAAKTGRVDEAADLYAELSAERDALRAQLATVPALPDSHALRLAAEEWVGEMRSTLLGDPDQRRAAFAGLLGTGRIRVAPDAERGFRVDAVLRVALETRQARDHDGDLRACRSFGSGGGI